MAFKNIRFPTGIRFGAMGGPRWLNDRVRLNSGRVKANQIQAYPLRRFQVARALKDDTTKREFLAFIHVIQGVHTFRLKDWGDYDVISGEGVFTALGSDQYQLVKRYTSGSITYDENIVLPVSGTLAVVSGGTPYTSGVDYTTSYTTPSGILTFPTSPTPAAPTSWTGEFDRLVMFDKDNFDIIWGEGDTFEAANVVIEEQPL